MSTRSSICVRRVFSTIAAPLARCAGPAGAALRRFGKHGVRCRVSPSLISHTSSPRLHTHTDDLNNTDYLDGPRRGSRGIGKKLNACRRPCAQDAPPATGDTHDVCPTLHAARVVRARAAAPAIHGGARAHAGALSRAPAATRSDFARSFPTRAVPALHHHRVCQP
jgi:hypothetical protein